MSKKLNWVYYLITPVLIAFWLSTGQEGWYNLLATYMSILFVIVSIILFAILMCLANGESFVTQKMQDATFALKFSVISQLLNICYACILIWHDKFIIGGMMIVLMFTGLWINKYIKGLKPEDLVPEKS